MGERMDCSGMRWIHKRAEALLHLRCIELNGQWDDFFQWASQGYRKKLMQGEKVIIRTNKPIDLIKNLNPTDDPNNGKKQNQISKEFSYAA
jgi:hypothetical protein